MHLYSVTGLLAAHGQRSGISTFGSNNRVNTSPEALNCNNWSIRWFCLRRQNGKLGMLLWLVAFFQTFS